MYWRILACLLLSTPGWVSPAANLASGSVPGAENPAGVVANPRANLIFKSGFEDGVSLQPPYNDGGGAWFQDLVGADGSGYAWPMHVWGADGTFQVLVDSSLDPNEYLENTLENTIGHDGMPTRALHMVQHQKAEGWTQDPYIFETGGIESGDIYVSYWMKYPSDLLARIGPDGWFAFLEWKTCCNDDRIAAYVYTDAPGSVLYWYVQNDNETDDAPNHQIYWDRENHEVPVPVGTWFRVEAFLHRSTGQDGRFWWAVNGQTVVDYHGPNKHTETFNRFMPFTLYTNAQQMDIWIDDIQIWDGLPHRILPLGKNRPAGHR
ncbi:MAG TPA: hypothetical protein ENJ00_03670 [Phycisphaerales bacterium]|nr:hypothetical protein [Phycisphaerales bacterium]